MCTFIFVPTARSIPSSVKGRQNTIFKNRYRTVQKLKALKMNNNAVLKRCSTGREITASNKKRMAYIYTEKYDSFATRKKKKKKKKQKKNKKKKKKKKKFRKKKKKKKKLGYKYEQNRSLHSKSLKSNRIPRVAIHFTRKIAITVIHC